MAIVIDATFWWKLSFIFVVFFEAFLTGLIPTWSKTCRENPKILGIANSFAAGVFLAIAFCHILPEEAANWSELRAAQGVDEPFPLPYVLLFCGYTLILLIDKVMFDTHALFDDGHGHGAEAIVDPAEIKLANNVRASMISLSAAQAT
jgi:zinc transporter ZupT